MRLDRLRSTLVVLLLAAGCAQTPATNTDSNSLSQVSGAKQDQYARVTPDEIRSEVLSFADTFITMTAQSLDELAKNTRNPQVASWAIRYKIETAGAALTSSTSPNPIISLIDTVVLVNLKCSSIEEHWIPALLHQEGKMVLDSFHHAKADAWLMANRILTPAQAGELRGMIEQWRKDNPGQYYDNNVRFANFNDVRHAYDRTGKPPAAGSLLSLLLIDPMAKMDPVARELRGYRLLSERIFFLAKRFPMVMSWEFQSAILETSENRQTQRFLTSVDTFNGHLKAFNDTTAAFATILRDYPKDLAKEREALINEFLEGITVQRKAMFEGLTAQHQALHSSITAQREGFAKDLQSEHERLVALLADARTTLKEVRDTSAAIKSSASDTVTQAEESSHRLVTRIFTCLLILVLVVLIVGPIMLLIYRYLASRIPAGVNSSRLPVPVTVDRAEEAVLQTH